MNTNRNSRTQKTEGLSGAFVFIFDPQKLFATSRIKLDLQQQQQEGAVLQCWRLVLVSRPLFSVGILTGSSLGFRLTSYRRSAVSVDLVVGVEFSRGTAACRL